MHSPLGSALEQRPRFIALRWNRASQLLGLILFLLLQNPAAAQKARRVFVVVPSPEQSARGPEMEAVVQSLKAFRKRYGIGFSLLPILRLQRTLPTHARLMTDLNLRPAESVQVLLCTRGEKGWPTEVLFAYEGPHAAEDAARKALGLPPLVRGPSEDKKPSGEVSKETVSGGQVGVLLLHRADHEEDQSKVKPFLAELGRYWFQRYGRVKPAPYPLAYYDLSKASVAERVEQSFPDLSSQKSPYLALCLFREGRPVRVLEVFSELSLPATLVRRLSSRRTQHLAHTVEIASPSSAQLPQPEALQLSQDLELRLVRSRLHEMARQLWSASQDGGNGVNRTTRRVLLRLADLTKPSSEAQVLESEDVRDLLEDLLEEPLILPKDSELLPVQDQLLKLCRLIVSR